MRTSTFFMFASGVWALVLCWLANLDPSQLLIPTQEFKALSIAFTLFIDVLFFIASAILDKLEEIHETFKKKPY